MGPRQRELLEYLVEDGAYEDLPEWEKEVANDLHCTRTQLSDVVMSCGKRGWVGADTFLSALAAGRNRIWITDAGIAAIRAAP